MASPTATNLDDVFDNTLSGRLAHRSHGEYDQINEHPRMIAIITLAGAAQIDDITAKSWEEFYRSNYSRIRINYQLLPFYVGEELPFLTSKWFVAVEQVGICLFDHTLLKRMMDYANSMDAVLSETVFVYFPVELDLTMHDFGCFDYLCGELECLTDLRSESMDVVDLSYVFDHSRCPLGAPMDLGEMSFVDLITKLSLFHEEHPHAEFAKGYAMISAGHVANHSLILRFQHACSDYVCDTQGCFIDIMYPIGATTGIVTALAHRPGTPSWFLGARAMLSDPIKYNYIMARCPSLVPLMNGLIPFVPVDMVYTQIRRVFQVLGSFSEDTARILTDLVEGQITLPADVPVHLRSHKWAVAMKFGVAHRYSLGPTWKILMAPHIACRSSVQLMLQMPKVPQLYGIRVPVSGHHHDVPYMPGAYIYKGMPFDNDGSALRYRISLPVDPGMLKKYSDILYHYARSPAKPTSIPESLGNKIRPSMRGYFNDCTSTSLRDYPITDPRFEFDIHDDFLSLTPEIAQSRLNITLVSKSAEVREKWCGLHDKLFVEKPKPHKHTRLVRADPNNNNSDVVCCPDSFNNSLREFHCLSTETSYHAIGGLDGKEFVEMVSPHGPVINAYHADIAVRVSAYRLAPMDRVYFNNDDFVIGITTFEKFPEPSISSTTSDGIFEYHLSVENGITVLWYRIVGEALPVPSFEAGKMSWQSHHSKGFAHLHWANKRIE